jgi:hypothetical protein
VPPSIETPPPKVRSSPRMNDAALHLCNCLDMRLSVKVTRSLAACQTLIVSRGSASAHPSLDKHRRDTVCIPKSADIGRRQSDGWMAGWMTLLSFFGPLFYHVRILLDSITLRYVLGKQQTGRFVFGRLPVSRVASMVRSY